MGEKDGIRNEAKLSHKETVEEMREMRKRVKPGSMSAGEMVKSCSSSRAQLQPVAVRCR